VAARLHPFLAEVIKNMFPAVIGWGVLSTIVIGLALYRKFIAMREEDDLIHLTGSQKLLSQQLETAGKLEKVDVWGKTLTIAAAIYGTLLLAIYLYGVWMDSLKVD
jgi:hypothetical protein